MPHSLLFSWHVLIVAPRYQTLPHGGRGEVEEHLLVKHRMSIPPARAHKRGRPVLMHLLYFIVLAASHHKDIDLYHFTGMSPRKDYTTDGNRSF